MQLLKKNDGEYESKMKREIEFIEEFDGLQSFGSSEIFSMFYSCYQELFPKSEWADKDRFKGLFDYTRILEKFKERSSQNYSREN